MDTQRGFFPEVIRRVLRDRVGSRCSNPSCQRETVGPANEIPSKAVLVGVAAHIRAASQGGPRYDAFQIETDRQSISNAIWLCEQCAALIDKNGGADYPIEVLADWKQHAEDRARARLQGVPFPSNQSQRIVHGLPSRNPHFSGRDSDIERLHNALDLSSVSPVVQAVYGLPGVGKTSLAVEYAHRYSDLYQGIWWALSDRRETLVDSLSELGAAVDPRLRALEDKELAARACLDKLGNDQSKPWLLIFDDATDPTVVRGLIPGKGARVILTTRWTDWAGWASEFHLDEMSPGDSEKFLVKRARRPDQKGAASLAQALGYLPLALDHAGAYVKLTGASFDSYRERLLQLIADLPKGALYPSSVAATFALAIDKACEECPDAMSLMELCSVVGSKNIPTALFNNHFQSLEALEKALLALASVSLLRHDNPESASPSVSVHQLVQAVMRGRLVEQDEIGTVISRMTDSLVQRFPANAEDPATWEAVSPLFLHFNRLREHVIAFRETPIRMMLLCEAAARHLMGRGFLAPAKILLEDAIRINNSAYGLNNQNTPLLLGTLGIIHERLDDFVTAEKCLRRSVELEEKRFGRKHRLVGFRLNNLGHLLWRMELHEQALPIARRALKIGEETLGAVHIDTAVRMNNLANIYRDLEKPDKAEGLYRKAISIGERTVGRDHADVVTWLNNLANLLVDLSKFAEAAKLFQEAITSAKKIYGPVHPDVARVMLNYAVSLLIQGRLEEASENAVVAMITLQQFLGPHHSLSVHARDVFEKVTSEIARKNSTN